MAIRVRRTHYRLSPNRLWKYRKRVGYTQRQVAGIIGYHSATDISHYEHGRKVPSLLTALKLEIVYHTPVAFLFTDVYVPLRTRLREREEQLRAQWEGEDRP